MKRAARTDANHADVKNALRAIGCYVVDCAHVGAGFPDLVCAWRGKWVFIEVKDGAKVPSARKLTPDQTIFHAEALSRNCRVHVVTSADEAIKAMQAETLGRVA
ncbi:hypothetical protein MBSD_n2128 [Mizugakiibacter sediminis]|uniref:Uncharacterized protein n=1 Tax=Mizugakiibacter sediminis TaxID=1475481 RepID=A0A0K8QPJ1_9GAMM|nr:VRR-NUC domain-containing protein [Mizugakiibacter sediminis]GAP66813.1 hypothetical protein MBSD_n2128 [Mizugakiibacter sediminis]